MSDMEQKVGSDLPKKKKLPAVDGSDNDNLGLDADHSSDENYGYLNNDNDRVSHNPDGEDDDHDTNEEPGHSPLMDK